MRVPRSETWPPPKQEQSQSLRDIALTLTSPSRVLELNAIESRLEGDPFLKAYLDALPELIDRGSVKFVSLSTKEVLAEGATLQELFENIKKIETALPVEDQPKYRAIREIYDGKKLNIFLANILSTVDRL
jgi:hypothetical protein